MVKIGTTDITANVQESTYKMDEDDVYTSWKDADGKNHRDVTRTQIKGSFDLVFVEGWGIDYTTFLTALNGAKSGSVVSLTVTVTNTNQTKTIDAYCKLTSSAPRKISSTRTFRKFKMTVEEQ